MRIDLTDCLAAGHYVVTICDVHRDPQMFEVVVLAHTAADAITQADFALSKCSPRRENVYGIRPATFGEVGKIERLCT